jgi:hypothetical protein
MNELTTMISDLGVPVAVTCASGALVYFLLNWVKSTLIGTIKSMGDEIEEELAKNEKILVRLIDKVNLLHWSTIEERCSIEEFLHKPVDYRLWSEASHKRGIIENSIKTRNGNKED